MAWFDRIPLWVFVNLDVVTLHRITPLCRYTWDHELEEGFTGTIVDDVRDLARKIFRGLVYGLRHPFGSRGSR